MKLAKKGGLVVQTAQIENKLPIPDPSDDGNGQAPESRCQQVQPPTSALPFNRCNRETCARQCLKRERAGPNLACTFGDPDRIGFSGGGSDCVPEARSGGNYI